MKLLLFLLSGSLLLASSVQAQIGVRAGGELSAFTKSPDAGNHSTTAHWKMGCQAGIFYQVPLYKHLSLVPELQFSRERFAIDTYYFAGEGVFRSEYAQSLSYLSLPILLRANLGAFYFETGPQASLLVGGRATGTQTLNGGFVAGVYSTPIDAAAVDSYHRFDAGPCVGVGVRLPAGLGLGLRAYWGFTRLADEQAHALVGQSYPGVQHRQTLQASLTYQVAAR